MALIRQQAMSAAFLKLELVACALGRDQQSVRQEWLDRGIPLVTICGNAQAPTELVVDAYFGSAAAGKPS